MKSIFSIAFFLLVTPIICFGQDRNLPGIYIVRNIDSTESLLPGLRARYQNCVTLKQNNMRLREEFPSYWQTASLAVSPEYSANITSIPRDEPPWGDEIVGFGRESEYFLNDQYVLIKESFDYDFTEDGLCTLIKTKKESRLIDNGEDVFKVKRKTAPRHINPNQPFDDPWMDGVNFVSYRINQYQSAVIAGAAANRDLSTILNDTQGLSNRITEMLVSDDATGVAPQTQARPPSDQLTAAQLRNLSQSIREVFDLRTTSISPSEGIPVAGSNYSAAGQSCDRVESQRNTPALCYWSVAHIYPSYSQRPIILRKEYRNVREIAERFEFISSIPEDIITPPESEVEPVLDSQ